MIRFSRDGKSVALFSFFYSFVFIIQIPQRQPNLNILTTCTRTIRASPVAQRKKSPCSAGAIEDAGSIPGLEESSGGGRGNPLQCSCLENPMYRGAWQAMVQRVQRVGHDCGTPLQYSCLENPMDGGAWWAAVHGVAKSRTRLSDFTFIFHFHALEKELATHSSVLAWRIPGTGEPGGLPSLGSHRVGHD